MLPVHGILLKPLEAVVTVADEGHVGEVDLLNVPQRLLPRPGVGLIEGATVVGAQPVVGRRLVPAQELVYHQLVLSDGNNNWTFSVILLLLQAGTVLVLKIEEIYSL